MKLTSDITGPSGRFVRSGFSRLMALAPVVQLKGSISLGEIPRVSEVVRDRLRHICGGRVTPIAPLSL